MDPEIYRLQLLQSYLSEGTEGPPQKEVLDESAIEEKELHGGCTEDAITRVGNAHIPRYREDRTLFSFKQDLDSLRGLGDYSFAERKARDARLETLRKEKQRQEAMAAENERLRLVAIWGSLGYSESHRCVLPLEALSHIAPFLGSSLRDIAALSAVSKVYHSLATAPSLWRRISVVDTNITHILKSRLSLLKFCISPMVAMHTTILDLSGSGVSDNELSTLLQSLGERLLQLNLSECKKITMKLWDYVGTFCTALTSLVADGCLAVTCLPPPVKEMKSTYAQLEMLCARHVRADKEVWKALCSSNKLKALSVTVAISDFFLNPPLDSVSSLESLSICILCDEVSSVGASYAESSIIDWCRQASTGILCLDLTFAPMLRSAAPFPFVGVLLSRMCDLHTLALRGLTQLDDFVTATDALRSLRLEFSASPEKPPQFLALFSCLTHIAVHNTRLRPLDIENLLCSRSLRLIELVGVSLEELPPVLLLPSLEALTLRDNPSLVDLPWTLLPLQRLEKLDLRNNSLMKGPEVGFLAKCPRLRWFSFSGNVSLVREEDVAVTSRHWAVARDAITKWSGVSLPPPETCATLNTRQCYAQGAYGPRQRNSVFQYSTSSHTSSSRKGSHLVPSSGLSSEGNETSRESCPPFDIDLGDDTKSVAGSLADAISLPPSSQFTRSSSLPRRSLKSSVEASSATTRSLAQPEALTLAAFTVLRVQQFAFHECIHFAFVTSDNLRGGGHGEGCVTVKRSNDQCVIVDHMIRADIVRRSAWPSVAPPTAWWSSFHVVPVLQRRLRVGVEHRVLHETHGGLKTPVHFWTAYVECAIDKTLHLSCIASLEVRTLTQRRRQTAAPFCVTIKSNKAVSPATSLVITFQDRFMLSPVMLSEIAMPLDGEGWWREEVVVVYHGEGPIQTLYGDLSAEFSKHLPSFAQDMA